MDFVERGDLDGEDLRKYLTELLFDYKHNPVDAAVLGCTHYPFVKKMISETLGENVMIFDGGNGTAKEMKRRLAEVDLLSDRSKKGTVEFTNSCGDLKKRELFYKLVEFA